MTRAQLLQARIALNNRIELCHQFCIETPNSTYWPACLLEAEGASKAIGEMQPTDGGVTP